MANKHSKATLALLAQFPGFDDWIINNLTHSQLTEFTTEGPSKVFSEGHPLIHVEMGVKLWRAYKSAVVFELNYRQQKSLMDFTQEVRGIHRLAYYHELVCMAISCFVREQPELLDKIVERMRREIEDSTGPAQLTASQSGAVERRNRL